MSKSLSLFVPALGGTVLVLGLAYGIASRHYGQQTITSLETRVAQTEASAARAREAARAAAQEAAKLAAERDALQDVASTSGDLTAPAPVAAAGFNLGRQALPEEIAAWDVDVLPDGRGLPVGSGDVWTGEEVFVDKCASCHGDFAEGRDNWPVLAGGFDTLADEDPVKTVGSYWPHLSTAWDYINRSMPFGEAGTLTADETYAIVAYLLYSNDMVDDDFVLSNENFTDVEMYNADGFVIDDRPALEYPAWRTEPCMENCKTSVEITMRATFLDVTPEDGGESVMNHASTTGTPTFSASAAADDDGAPTATIDGMDPTLVAAGEGAFRQCSSCHQVGASARNSSGPQLNGLLGRTIGSVDGFRYSNTFGDANAAGDVWTEENLAAFLADPRGAMPGTKMSFRGVRNEEDIAALIAYLASVEAE
ncbi:c-type cytochrome [Cognatiyoonia sp. IB215182]|uniref:c-type cytochrome n=1 Tax=Cognatiyoonia sp. IB215182 TaxID=3097353 RepID=UPI002A14FBD5|nr:c-type cytochrome [Cognatiyoonia sp. IB215182]MDX8350850.1 c-type cytochrome [Cognatiyoonia sp. IB215182]